MKKLINFILQELPSVPLSIIEQRIENTLIEFSRERIFSWSQQVVVGEKFEGVPLTSQAGFYDYQIKSDAFFLENGFIKPIQFLTEGVYSVDINGLLEDYQKIPTRFIDTSIEMIGYAVIYKILMMPDREWSNPNSAPWYKKLSDDSMKEIKSSEHLKDDQIDRQNTLDSLFVGDFSVDSIR